MVSLTYLRGLEVNDADPVVSGRGHYYVFALYLRPGEFGEFGYVLVKIG
mgnify:CR=1 FL=1